MSAHVGPDGGRRCTGCGASVENLPYEFWLFATCRSCGAERSPQRWKYTVSSDVNTGTARKWSYWPRWHFTQVADNGSQEGQP